MFEQKGKPERAFDGARGVGHVLEKAGRRIVGARRNGTQVGLTIVP